MYKLVDEENLGKDFHWDAAGRREGVAAGANRMQRALDLNEVVREALGGRAVDFAFSYIVFQHIPSREVIDNFVRDVFALLRPGGLFKFQVQGHPEDESRLDGVGPVLGRSGQTICGS